MNPIVIVTTLFCTIILMSIPVGNTVIKLETKYGPKYAVIAIAAYFATVMSFTLGILKYYG